MKKIKKVLSIFLVMALATSLMSVSAAAFLSKTPTVVYDAAKEEFSFKNVKVYEHTEENAHEHPQNVDLFPDMKGAFPGDEFSQQVKVEVKNALGKQVRIYLRTENPNEDFQTLIGSAGSAEPANAEGTPVLRVEHDGKTYTATIDEGIEMGAFSGNQETVIDVTLAIPIEAGNELQGLIAEIDWVFTADVITVGGGGGGGGEEPPIDLPDEDPPLADLPDEEPPLAELPDEEPPLAVLPQTGLLQWPILVMGLAGLLLIAVGILSEQKRKARNN